MFIRLLRQRRKISQEQLAELCGLSLRTIQRVESGHRVSYATLRALATAFSIDVDRLETELYAMDTKATEHRELPLWVRMVLGRGWFFGSRSKLHKIEMLSICAGIGLVAFWVASRFWPFVQDPVNGTLYFGLFLFFCAYWASACIRIGERYKAWSQEPKNPGMQSEEAHTEE